MNAANLSTANLSASERQPPLLMLASPILTMNGIRKSFGDVQAPRGIDVTVYPDDVAALIDREISL